MVTQERLKELLNYDPETGLFTNKTTRGNRAKIGEVAGGLDSDGYITICVDYRRYKAHILAFLYMEGYMPEHEVDHKKGIRTDNRWKELRHVSKSCNHQNLCINKNNTSGFPGVCRTTNKNIKWRTEIGVNNKRVYLGSYDTPLEAALVRLTFEMQCEKWTCNYRSELAKAIKRVWPEIKLF